MVKAFLQKYGIFVVTACIVAVSAALLLAGFETSLMAEEGKLESAASEPPEAPEQIIETINQEVYAGQQLQEETPEEDTFQIPTYTLTFEASILEDEVLMSQLDLEYYDELAKQCITYAAQILPDTNFNGSTVMPDVWYDEVMGIIDVATLDQYHGATITTRNGLDFHVQLNWDRTRLESFGESGADFGLVTYDPPPEGEYKEIEKQCILHFKSIMRYILDDSAGITGVVNESLMYSMPDIPYDIYLSIFLNDSTGYKVSYNILLDGTPRFNHLVRMDAEWAQQTKDEVENIAPEMVNWW